MNNTNKDHQFMGGWGFRSLFLSFFFFFTENDPLLAKTPKHFFESDASALAGHLVDSPSRDENEVEFEAFTDSVCFLKKMPCTCRNIFYRMFLSFFENTFETFSIVGLR